MCLYPRLIKNRKYTANKKNGGNIPVCTDERTLWVPVGCGKCIECMKQKKRQWQVRLQEELKVDRQVKFITLTFSEESLSKLTKDIVVDDEIMQNAIATIAMRRFLERWRKEYKTSVKHLFITELGHENTERIHLHGLLWCNKDNETIERIWKYGHIWVGEYVNEKTINYIVKYINKIDIDHKGYVPKILCSPGIGKNYLERWDSKRNKFRDKETIEYYKTSDGSKLNLPIYYRNKIYTDYERERLWLNRLDEGKRYVCGVEVDVKDNEDEYYKILEFMRGRNARLGYGDDSFDWSKANYKRQCKKLKKLKNQNDED